MEDYAIFSDSSCDIPQELIEQHHIDIVPYYVSFDGNTYHKEGVDLSTEEFYRILRQSKAFPKTSLPPVSDYIEAFTPNLRAGRDILCICLTSKFSGSFQCATIAGNSLMEEFPQRNITVIDSTQVSGAQGQLVLLAARLREQGKDMREVHDILKKARASSKIIITVDSLEYLKRGGRIGKVSALAGGLLGIRPIIAMEDGELVPVSKVRGRKKAVTEIISLTLADIGPNPHDYTLSVIHSDCLEEAQELLEQLKTEYKLDVSPIIFELGVTIGAHIGPSVLAVTYMKKL